MSGFLVVRSFLNQLQEAGGMTRGLLGSYYKRRAKRILPAYLVVVLLVTVIGLIIPPLRARALRELPFYLTFTANHTEIVAVVLWSISLEVQFYVLLPLVGAGRAGRRVADWVASHPGLSLAAAFGVPAAYRLALFFLHPELAMAHPQPYAPGVDPKSLSAAFGATIYGSSLGHADGLLLGGWLGVQWHRRPGLPESLQRMAGPSLLLGGAVFGSMYLVLSPWRTWMPRPAVLGVLGFTGVAAGALLMVIGATLLAREPREAPRLVQVLRWGSDRIYSLYLAQALVSVLIGMLLAWVNLSPMGGVVVTCVYVFATMQVGSILFAAVERRFYAGAGAR
jgi:peptidoglycan/LPS O-acetylase OafA/YrhL